MVCSAAGTLGHQQPIMHLGDCDGRLASVPGALHSLCNLTAWVTAGVVRARTAPVLELFIHDNMPVIPIIEGISTPLHTRLLREVSCSNARNDLQPKVTRQQQRKS